jgi:hypothetical protein
MIQPYEGPLVPLRLLLRILGTALLMVLLTSGPALLYGW